MPDLTERKLLCRTCGGERSAVAPCAHGRRICSCMNVHPGRHPFDGVPYVPCPECGGFLYAYALAHQDAPECPTCASSPVPGLVREEA